ncbi:flagellum-associated coiled-coil domain-containing protein 1 isoform X1 [Equus caballus]|uniref:Flagellum associated containing coiled-coil domains 1 n=1 Tax=Equus caballus TaxID=9796 RepID=F6U6S0_HORSE|nr:amyotrophic lateral sclerosis 2 chromosomal region candidate gene 12 protein isoform X1 [Equus caballus]XP_023478124.1 amyotrophic lateral sclerosis 2 chromosomal region candidate gene 12 protein isoform X1 [Equus caballus]XP_023478125.1 amyotrophic lateral sclerosis 2 chromosomal region candidate gene 12 protein isoform X1 [Equus caballus]XP_023478126.1 amyotrophic lateral sclerosis 2 chromosomal region candidate gene 12 protein isoform X1 [Equus caballus]
MDPNPLIYCTCWDPWNSGPRKLIKTPQPLSKSSTGKPKLTPLPPASKKQNYVQPTTKPVVAPKVKTHFGKQEESNKSPCEVINVSPGYRLTRNREQISVTLGDEMFDRKKQSESEIMDKVKISRTDIIVDLEEQISELTVIIEQMNRDHQSTQKLLSHEMDLRCAKMQQSFENKTRKLKEAHAAELTELENNYKAALRAEKLAAQEKLEEMQKEYKYLKNMFYMYQDSIYDELEDKWSKKKAEWEKDEKLEREKILLKQKHNITKKFELESEEEKKKIQDSHSAVFENFNREKEELLKQHERDTLQLEELRKTKEVIEEELHTQALILESLNTTLYQTQMELQKEKAVVGNLEKKLQAKLAEAEEKFKYTIQLLTEENIHLRQKIIAKNEEIYQRYGRSPSLTVYEEDSDTLEDGSKKRQES